MESIFYSVRRLISLLTGSVEDNMDAKGQDTIKAKSEMQFFELIDKRMAQQGFEVLETVCSDRNSTTKSEQRLAHKWTNLSY